MAYLATDETIDRSRRCPHYNMCSKPLQHSDIMRSLSKQYTEYSLLLWLSDANVIGVTWRDGTRRWRHARLGHRIECHAFRPFKLRRFTLEIIPDLGWIRNVLIPDWFCRLRKSGRIRNKNSPVWSCLRRFWSRNLKRELWIRKLLNPESFAV